VLFCLCLESSYGGDLFLYHAGNFGKLYGLMGGTLAFYSCHIGHVIGILEQLPRIVEDEFLIGRHDFCL